MSLRHLIPASATKPPAPAPVPVPPPPAPAPQVTVNVDQRPVADAIDAIRQAMPPVAPRAWEFTIHRDRTGRIDKVTARAVED